MNFAGSETVSASGGIVLNASFKLTASGTASFSTEKFKLADIDTNYLTCADSTQSITIASGSTTDAFVPTIDAENGKVGDTVTTTVSIPENTNAAGGSFNLVYDNTKMELVDATAGDVISSFSKTVNKTYAANKIRLNFAGSESVSSAGGIVLIASFKLVSEGEATFSTEKFKLADIDTNYLKCEDSSKYIIIENAALDIINNVTITNTSSNVIFSIALNSPVSQGVIAVASYDNLGNMLDIRLVECNGQASCMEVLNKYSGTSYAKVFILNSKLNLKPMTKPKIIDIN